MGASLHFADIAPPRLAEPTPGPLSGLPELMQAISNHRDAVAQAQQQLELERQRTEASVSASNQQTAESKQRMAQEAADNAVKALQLQAHDIVGAKLADVATRPGSNTASGFLANTEIARGEILSDPKNKKLVPYLVDAFNSQQKNAADNLKASADARSAETNANVDASTATGRVAGTNANNRVAAATADQRIADAKATLAIHQQAANFDPQQQAALQMVLQSGDNLGKARALASGLGPHKIGPFDGVSDDYVLPGTQGTKGAEVAKAQVSLMLFHSGREVAENADTGDMNFLSQQALAHPGGIRAALAKGITSPAQQNLVDGITNMGIGVSHFLGGGSSEAASDRMFSLVSSVSGKDQKATKDRSFLLNSLEQAMIDVASGTHSPSQATAALLGRARAQGLPPDALNGLNKLRSDATIYEKSDAYKAMQSVPNTAGAVAPTVTRSFKTGGGGMGGGGTPR